MSSVVVRLWVDEDARRGLVSVKRMCANHPQAATEKPRIAERPNDFGAKQRNAAKTKRAVDRRLSNHDF